MEPLSKYLGIGFGAVLALAFLIFQFVPSKGEGIEFKMWCVLGLGALEVVILVAVGVIEGRKWK